MIKGVVEPVGPFAVVWLFVEAVQGWGVEHCNIDDTRSDRTARLHED
ncbi:hypothetical protein AM1_0063 [Acaryochloris marina MBIC11017]|uniref:Uncharacterized protein n=1 Tax=Acaryochloris marina (strain MBIC 11017) TaxID=329726 RepID=B0C539_ACAM1|nr:hypothetical protein AM1_0063 [Acaryochloris marina MBIC11017]